MREVVTGFSVCVEAGDVVIDFSFALSGAFSLSLRHYPRLAAWAAFCRRFAACDVQYSAFDPANFVPLSSFALPACDRSRARADDESLREMRLIHMCGVVSLSLGDNKVLTDSLQVSAIEILFA